MDSVGMIICHFNDSHLPCAVASLERQSKNVNIILVDDGSTQESKRIYEHMKGIEKIELPQNKGIGNARRVGLSRSLKENLYFIGFLDSDGIAHPRFVEEAVERLNRDQSVMGVCAKKGLANPCNRIAMMKYRYKTYKKDEFQLDCSLFRREAFDEHRIPERRVGEDSAFILSFPHGKLVKLGIPYYHFERESFADFFRDEYYGAFHSFKANHKKTFLQILLTPFTSAKMIMRNHWILEGALFPFRQLVWLVGYLNGSRSVS